jgi:hypothetical protein
MAGVAVPRADRSGKHRVVDVEVGDVRALVAQVGGVATLARAQGVGPKALRDALPELRAACAAAPASIAHAVLPACDVVALSTGLSEDARAVVDALVGVTRSAMSEVTAAIDGCERRGIVARTRLALQSSCDHAVEVLARARWSIELLQRASLAQPVPVPLEDLFRELEQGDELGGPDVRVALVGAVDAVVAVHPRVATAVLLGAIGCAHAVVGGRALVVRATSIDGGRVRLEVRAGEAADAREVIMLPVPRPAPYEERVVRVAAATLAAPMHVDESGAVLELLSA